MITTATQRAFAPTLPLIDADGTIRIAQEGQLACTDGVWHHAMADASNTDHHALFERDTTLMGWGEWDGPAKVYRLPDCAWSFAVPVAHGGDGVGI